MSYNPLEQGEVTQVMVKTTDGKTWLAEYDSSRNLVPVKLLHEDPPKKLVPEPLAEPEPSPEPVMPTKAMDAFDKFMRDFKKVSGGMSPGVSFPGGVFNPLGDSSYKSTPNHDPGKPEILPKLDDTVFRAKLSSVMTDNKYDRVVKGRTRGKLDMTRLFKSRTRSTSIFTQKSERKNKVYNIILCIDESGSMTHTENKRTRADLAAEVGVYLAKNFVGLNINLAIVGFNHYFMVHKDFDQRITDYKKLHEEIRVGAFSDGSGCNHDLDAMSTAYRMFGERAGQNILVFMSDGQPATCDGVEYAQQNPIQYLDALKNKKDGRRSSGRFWNERTKSPIAYDPKLPGKYYDRDQSGGFRHLIKANELTADIIGVGIQSPCRQVPKAMEVTNLDELKPLMIQAIKSKVRRG